MSNISAHAVQKITQISPVFKKLISEARKARTNSYSPYSRFKVGAALLGDSGKIYRGTNVENASYGLTICAERSAVAQAVSAGEKKFKAIAVCGGGKEIIPPCGACRQVLLEFGPDIQVFMVSESNQVLSASLSHLLPAAFSKQNL